MTLRFTHNYAIITYMKGGILLCLKLGPLRTLEIQLKFQNFAMRTESLFSSPKTVMVTLVVMSIEMYEEMIETARTDMAISEAEKEFSADGVLLNARETLSSLRRKHFG